MQSAGLVAALAENGASGPIDDVEEDEEFDALGEAAYADEQLAADD